MLPARWLCISAKRTESTLENAQKGAQHEGSLSNLAKPLWLGNPFVFCGEGRPRTRGWYDAAKTVLLASRYFLVTSLAIPAPYAFRSLMSRAVMEIHADISGQSDCHPNSTRTETLGGFVLRFCKTCVAKNTMPSAHLATFKVG